MEDAEARPPSAPPTEPRPSPSRVDTSDPNLRSCFICLQNSAETPGATWVNPCPCTLEAHEDCLLAWIAETEASNPAKGLRCPACGGRIRVVEPRDPFLHLRDRLHRRYSRLSPWLLLGIFATSATAGSSYYGLMASTAFAGPVATTRWLGLARAVMERSIMGVRVPWWRWRAGWEVGFKFWLLHLVAPSLMLNKALPSLATLLAIPASLVYGATLVARDDLPTWPPSPAWAITMMPYVSISYSSVYYQLFGPLERRLNTALRRRIPAGEAAPEPEVAAEDDADGVFATLLRTANAVLGLFRNDDIEFEAGVAADEVFDIDVQWRVRPGQEDQNEAPVDARQALEDAVLEEMADPEQGVQEAAAADAAADAVAAAAAAAAGDVDAADPPPAIALQPGQDNAPGEAPQGEQQQQQGGQQEEAAAGEVNQQSTTFTDLINGVVSALTLPWVAWGAGEAIRRALPPAWVTRTAAAAAHRRGAAAKAAPPAGLLHERWGRSLVGACVFIVLKDALNLYTKYRRVEVRKRRRVKNVERRRRGAAAAPAR